jgi:hypothetical protein
MSQRKLVECPSCNRHVFADACACPFCAAIVSGHSCAPPVGRARLGRAARMAAAASLLGMSACGYSSSYGTMGGLDADSARSAAEQAADTSNGGAGAGSADGGAGAAANVGESGGGPRDGG